MSETYQVWQFLSGGAQEKVRDGVGPEEAVKAAHHYTHNVAARLGLTERVIITDDGDCTVLEWRKGQGIVFPPEMAGRK